MRKSKAPRSLAAPCNLHMICVMFDLSLPKSIMKVSDTEKRLELVVNVTCDMPCHSQMEVACPYDHRKKCLEYHKCLDPLHVLHFQRLVQFLLTLRFKASSTYSKSLILLIHSGRAESDFPPNHENRNQMNRC